MKLFVVKSVNLIEHLVIKSVSELSWFSVCAAVTPYHFGLVDVRYAGPDM